MKTSIAALAAAVAFAFAGAQASAQTPGAPSHVPLSPHEGDFTVKDFKFKSGETLPELRLHYMTLGTPRRDAHGHVVSTRC